MSVVKFDFFKTLEDTIRGSIVILKEFIKINWKILFSKKPYDYLKNQEYINKRIGPYSYLILSILLIIYASKYIPNDSFGGDMRKYSMLSGIKKITLLDSVIDSIPILISMSLFGFFLTYISKGKSKELIHISVLSYLTGSLINLYTTLITFSKLTGDLFSFTILFLSFVFIIFAYKKTFRVVKNHFEIYIKSNFLSLKTNIFIFLLFTLSIFFSYYFHMFIAEDRR